MYYWNKFYRRILEGYEVRHKFDQGKSNVLNAINFAIPPCTKNVIFFLVVVSKLNNCNILNVISPQKIECMQTL